MSEDSRQISSVSDFVIQRVREWGVSRVFGFPGDGIGEFYGALEKAQREENGLDPCRHGAPEV